MTGFEPWTSATALPTEPQPLPTCIVASAAETVYQMCQIDNIE